MNEDFVSFGLAQKLTLKGFNDPCIAYYDEGFLRYNTKYPFVLTAEELIISHNSECTWVDAPTISQVLKWLREEKVLFVEVSVNNYTGFDFYFTIYEKGEEGWIVCGFNEEWYDTYEGAALAGIECVLDNLI